MPGGDRGRGADRQARRTSNPFGPVRHSRFDSLWLGNYRESAWFFHLNTQSARDLPAEATASRQFSANHGNHLRDSIISVVAQEMPPRDGRRSFAVSEGQWAHSGVGIANLVRGKAGRRKFLANRLQQVRNFF